MRIAGVHIGSAEVQMVVLDWLNPDPIFVLVHQRELGLAAGPRPQAYHDFSAQFSAVLDSQKIERFYFNASVVPPSTKLTHLEAAELRGVVQSTAITHSEVVPVTNANISRNFGKRKSAEYLKDDAYWAKTVQGTLPKGYRPAALTAIAGALM
jgi:hypothetical protein